MDINILGIISLFFAIVNIALGIVVLVRNPKKANNIVYALNVFSIAIWIILTYFYNNPVVFPPDVWLKIVYLASYGMLFTQLLFAYYFPRKIKGKFYLYLIPILITLIPSIYVLLFKDSVIVSAINYRSLHLSVARMGPDYWIYTLPNVLGIFLIAPYFLSKSKLFTGYEKAQVRFYVIGTLLMMIPVVIIDYFLPIFFNDTRFFVLGPLFAIPFTIATAYPILESRFIRIPVIISNTVTLLLNVLFIFSSFIAYDAFTKTEYFLNSTMSVSIFLFAFIFVLLYFFIFRNIVNLIVKNIDKDQRKRKVFEKNFLQINGVELTMGRIIVNLQRSIKDIFAISSSGVLLYDKVNFSSKYFFYPESEETMLAGLTEIAQFWDKARLGKMIVADELKRENILQETEIPEAIRKVLAFMDKYNIAVLYPFNSRTRLNGILILGYRADNYPLSKDEVDVLERMVDNVSLSVGRAILYDEIQEFSNTLQGQVDEQTKELQLKVAELEEARRKERDMIDIMGHELRTPITIAKLNIDLMKQFIPSNPEEYKKYLDRVKNSIESEIRLINALLTSAKLEGEKVEISRQRISVSEVIEHVIHSYTYEAESKNLRVIQDIDEDTPDVFADKDRFTEIVDNLLNNAIKYTNEGSIIIQTSHTRDHVQVNVIDTGIGIPEEELSMLGTKFHRVGNYINGSDDSNFEIVRPGGTGLGLYVVFALVEQMGGKIWVKSDAGKGTTFSFTLPAYTNQREEVVDSKTKNMYKRIGLKNS